VTYQRGSRGVGGISRLFSTAQIATDGLDSYTDRLFGWIFDNVRVAVPPRATFRYNITSSEIDIQATARKKEKGRKIKQKAVIDK
jgi:hypothetical protein